MTKIGLKTSFSIKSKERKPTRNKRDDTMVADNTQVTSRPVPRRTEGGVAGTNEGGEARTTEGEHHKHIIKQPHMPTKTQDTNKDASTQDKAQHARHRSHGKRTCGARRRPEADANLHAQR